MKQRISLRFATVAFAFYWLTPGIAVADCMKEVPLALAMAITRYAEKVPDTYVAVMHDLNSDGSPEAVVFLTDEEFCGSGGCNLLVFQRRAQAWHLVSYTLAVKPPIRVVPQRQRGWSSLSVFVQGGGIVHGYSAILPFGKRGYPLSPTTPPAFRAHGKVTGDVLITSYRCLP